MCYRYSHWVFNCGVLNPERETTTEIITLWENHWILNEEASGILECSPSKPARLTLQAVLCSCWLQVALFSKWRLLVVYLKFKYHWMFRFIWLPSLSTARYVSWLHVCSVSLVLWVAGSGRALHTSQRSANSVGQALVWGPLIQLTWPDPLNWPGKRVIEKKNRCQSWCCLAAAQIVGLASSPWPEASHYNSLELHFHLFTSLKWNQ